MAFPLRHLAHSVLDFLAEHVHLKLKHRKQMQQLQTPPVQHSYPPIEVPASAPQKRIYKKPKDYTPLTEAQLFALMRQFEKAEAHNANPNRTTPRITHEDIGKWANRVFGLNKSHKTYSRYYLQYRQGELNVDI